jgi:hypothetical protein
VSKGIAGITKAAKWERKIVPMYVLVKRAVIKPRYGFAPAAVDVVKKNFNANFDEAFQQAVRRRRGNALRRRKKE